MLEQDSDDNAHERLHKPEPAISIGVTTQGRHPCEDRATVSADTANQGTGLADLLARCAERDHEAFDELHRRTHRRLHAFARNLLTDRTGAEDAVQESYIKIWHRARQFNGNRGAPMTWMLNIVRHQIVDLLRRREHRTAGAMPLEDDLAGSSRDPASEVNSVRTLANVIGNTSAAGSTARSCLELVYEHGYNCAEAARHLGVPVSTAKTWVSRSVAKAKARAAIDR